jgi:drug/metabolite transporter (DMT)-like permease
MWLVFAAASAMCFGLRGILYQWSSQKPLDRNLMLFGVYLCGTLVTFIANIWVGQAWSEGMLMGMSMGFSSFIANASMYKGFAVGKASMVAVFIGLPPVVVVIVAFFLWEEKLNWGQMAAFIVVLCGIVILRYSKELSLSNLKGIHWAILAMFGFGFTDLTSKQAVLWNGQVLPTLSMMFATGALLFLISWWCPWAGKELKGIQHKLPQIKLWSFGRTLLWGIVVGFTNCCGMILLLPAFKLGVTGLVSAVAATNVLMILFFARSYLKERFNRLEQFGITLTIVGVFLLRLLV